MRAFQSEVGLMMIERLAVEDYDFKIAALVIGVTMVAFERQSLA